MMMRQRLHELKQQPSKIEPLVPNSAFCRALVSVVRAKDKRLYSCIGEQDMLVSLSCNVDQLF